MFIFPGAFGWRFPWSSLLPAISPFPPCQPSTIVYVVAFPLVFLRVSYVRLALVRSSRRHSSRAVSRPFSPLLCESWPRFSEFPIRWKREKLPANRDFESSIRHAKRIHCDWGERKGTRSSFYLIHRVARDVIAGIVNFRCVLGDGGITDRAVVTHNEAQ